MIFLFQISGGLCLVACILFPFGWANNSEVTQICGPDSSAFNPGENNSQHSLFSYHHNTSLHIELLQRQAGCFLVLYE